MHRLIWYPGQELLLPHIVRAENCWLYDAQGNRYVDLESGVWCTTLGHSHPRIYEVLAEQSGRIAHTGFCYANEVVEEAAQAVLSLLGFADGRCVFLSAGSEAVEYGVRVAQAIAGRPLLMTMSDTYAGAYGSAKQFRSDEWFRFDWSACASCPYAEECSPQCEHWAAIPFADIGGLLFEPGSSSGLVRFPPTKLLHNLVARIRQNNGLVLANEVTTGIGRTGIWFGYQHYNIEPDIVALGKSIGNGYPVSVTAFAPGVYERLGSTSLKYAQSHQNDPLGAAIVRTVIAVIQQEGLIERGRQIADLLLSGLEGIRQHSGQIAAIRSRGLMIAVELHDTADGSFTVRTHRELVQRGYIVGLRTGTSVLRIDPALTIEQEDIAGFLETFAAELL
jgi:acetylornithine aminotransferase